MSFVPSLAMSPAKEMFELAVEISPSGIVMVDGGGRMLMINNEMERLFGYRRDELIGRTVDILVPVRLRTQHVRHLDAFNLRPGPRRMGAGRDLFGLRKDGTEFPIEIGLNPVNVGESFLVLSTIVDISERKRAEEMLRLAFETCPSGMVMTDGAGKMTIINNEIERLFGYRRDELIGQQVDILVPERQRIQHVRHRREFGARPEARRLGASRDLFGMRKDGSEFAVEIGLNPIRVGGDLFVLSAIVDISARKQRERRKDEFVSTVSMSCARP
jgi:PAS domain S-box-containing protein